MIEPSGTTSSLRVSAIVPAYLAAPTIERCLGSLFDQDTPTSDYEILVILNGPDDGSAAVIQRLRAEHPAHRVQVLSCPVASAGAARNVGLDHAQGENILFVDADDWVSQDYISLLLAAADGTSIPAAGLVDVRTDGTLDTDTAVLRSLGGRGGPSLAVEASTALAAISACKLFPRTWVQDVRFDETLRSGEDIVFNATLLRPFARRFAQFRLTPLRCGAQYYRRLSDNSVSRQAESYDFRITQRLAVLRALTSGPEAHPDDRTRLTALFIQSQTAMMLRFLNANPAYRERAQQDLADAGVIGVDLSAGEQQRWPGYGTAISGRPPGRSQRVAIISGTTGATLRRKHQISLLRANEVRVRAAFLSGPLGKDFPPIPRLRISILRDRPAKPLRPGHSRAQRGLHTGLTRVDRIGRKVVRRAAIYALPPTLIGRLVADPKARNFFQRATVVALDADGAAAAHGLGLQPQPVEWFDGYVLATAAVSPPMSRPEARAVAVAAESLATLPTESPLLPPAQVWALVVWRLLRNTRRAEARRILEAARTAHPDSANGHVWDLLRLLADILDDTRLGPDYAAVCTAVMVQADRLMETGAVDHSLFLTELVIETLLHSEVQSNVADPPLIRDPEALLAPLTGSALWQRLTAPVDPGLRPQTPPSRADRGRPSVLFLPGAYPKFSAAVLNALEGHADTELLRLTDFGAQYGNTGPSIAALAQRHTAAVGGMVDVSGDIAEAFAGRDVIFADWADKGAVLASVFAPPEARLIVRFHGVDSLAVWQFLIDWSRVTDVMFVSEHLRRTVVDHLGDRLAGVRQHVSGHVVDVARFDTESTGPAHRTLGLVGWGQRVKDPLWALEVLALLRAEDPRWRLKLIGADFPAQHPRVSENNYAAAFRDRAMQHDICSAIDYVGYTRQLPGHLADVGFALSSSLRESWHIGVMEMVAAQAVPVIRDWPMYRDHGGAGSLFPSDWVVQTPAEAVERIHAHADEAIWRAAATTAREHVRAAFGSGVADADYRRIILGK